MNKQKLSQKSAGARNALIARQLYRGIVHGIDAARIILCGYAWKSSDRRGRRDGAGAGLANLRYGYDRYALIPIYRLLLPR